MNYAYLGLRMPWGFYSSVGLTFFFLGEGNFSLREDPHKSTYFMGSFPYNDFVDLG